MRLQEALIELLERLGAARDGKVYVDEAELREWPSEAVAALKQQKLLARARPAKSVVCPGCERACAMTVQTLTRANGIAASFVVCDKRDDINRVPIAAELLKQWRCDGEGVGEFVAKSLGVPQSQQQPVNPALRPIGMAQGDERRQMLCLRLDGQIAVVAGNKSQPLVEMVEFDSGKFNVDANAIRALVDSVTASDSSYTPSVDRRKERKLDTQAMYEQWRRAYRELKKQSPNMTDVWYSRRIAKMDIARGKSSDTIRKHMKK